MKISTGMLSRTNNPVIAALSRSAVNFGVFRRSRVILCPTWHPHRGRATARNSTSKRLSRQKPYSRPHPARPLVRLVYSRVDLGGRLVFAQILLSGIFE